MTLNDVLDDLDAFLYGLGHEGEAMDMLLKLRAARQARPEGAVAKDAARYRWWRENFGVEYDGPETLKLYTIINARFRRGLSEPIGFNAAIDGAMAGSSTPPQRQESK